MSKYADIFKVFEQFPDTAPTNLAEVAKLEDLCREHGKESLADYLYNWRTDMEYRLEREWTVPDAEPSTN